MYTFQFFLFTNFGFVKLFISLILINRKDNKIKYETK